MRPSLASIWLLIAVQTVSARTSFYTSSAAYCSTARAIEVQKFALEYTPDTNSLSFDINARSVAPDLDAQLSITLDAYGLVPINFTINLCDLLYGLLCPLPRYNFVSTYTLPLDTLIGRTVADSIPQIAYILPNLEAVATVQLVDVNTGAEAACLEAHLSNGKTVQMAIVAWGFGIIALLGLIVGLYGAAVAFFRGYDVERGRKKERLLAIFSFYQFAATTGLLSLAYPTVFVAFTANLAWSLGLIGEKPIQESINALRARTGGNLTIPSGNLVYGVGTEASRQLSTVSPISVDGPVQPPSARFLSLVSQLASELQSEPSRFQPLAKRQNMMPVPDVEITDPFNQINSGIPQYLARTGIPPSNGFMTVFYNFLFFLCIFLASALVLGVPCFIASKRLARKEVGDGIGGGRSATRISLNLLRANALRLLLISWYPILIFSFYQWTIGSSDAYAPIILSVFTWVSVTVAIIVMSLLALLYIFKKRETAEEAAEHLSGPSGGRAYAPLWNNYRPRRYWFFVPLLVATMVRALFIAFSKNRGWVQTIGLLVIETIVLLAMYIFMPFSDRSLNGSTLAIQFVRVAISGALVTFNTSIALNEIARTIIGFVLIVCIAVVSVGLLLLVLIDFVTHTIHIFRRPREKGEKAREGDASHMEEARTGSRRSSIHTAHGATETPSDSTTLQTQSSPDRAPKLMTAAERA